MRSTNEGLIPSLIHPRRLSYDHCYCHRLGRISRLESRRGSPRLAAQGFRIVGDVRHFNCRGPRREALAANHLAFFEFHEFMYGLDPQDVKRIRHRAGRLSVSDNFEDAYVDMHLLLDTAAYLISLSDPIRGGWSALSAEVELSYRFWARQARSWPEVTSEHLIALAKRLIEESKEKENVEVEV